MSGTITAYRAEPYSYREARGLVEELGVSEPMAITLVRRGYRTPEQAQAFLAADESFEPSRFNSMAAVVTQVLAAVRDGERITVYGDFDVDGVCATTILVSTLEELGANHDWLIPDRVSEGYGVSAENVRRLAERGTSLLITVDCGVTSVEEVALARSLGMAVVVTDHHEPAAELPECPILHPALDGYPFSGLCGTAVSWKLACALRKEAGAAGAPEDDLDLVALATVADMVPLVGENRFLVRRGLEEVRRARRPGIRALLDAAYCERTQLDEGDLSFRLAPRINAAGRLYRADAGVELFLTTDEKRAAEIATELNRANSERRSTESGVENGAEAALRHLPDELRQAPGFVLAGENWHPGVIGIVASRLVDRHHRPMVVVALDGEGGGRGSGRSIPGFDLLAALQHCSEHLVRFGGHRAAAGLELREENLAAFQQAFAAYASSVLGADDLERTERIDAMVGGAGLGLDLAEELSQLAPFGLGNPGVRLLVPSARISDVQPMGNGKHARFNLHSGAHRALGVAFGRSSLGVRENESVDAAVRLEINRWNGSVEPRIVLRELYPHSGPSGDEQLTFAEEWRRDFEAELGADPTAWPPSGLSRAKGNGKRHGARGSSSPAAVIGELASSGEQVLAFVADKSRRANFAKLGATLVEGEALESEPGLAGGFEHVVLVDPPSFPHLEQLVARPCEGGGYLHRVWGEAEWRVAHATLGARHAQRRELIALFRDLRDAGEVSGEEFRQALRGGGKHPRCPLTAARCLRVLSELELVVAANLAEGVTGVVSSQRTDLERSAAFRAYSARYQEGHQYLESRRQS